MKALMVRLLLSTLALFICVSHVNSQIVVGNTQSPVGLVQDVLLGTGVVATNITYNGSAVNANSVQSNVSFFDASSTSFPIPFGVLLTTGQGNAAVGPNNSGSYAFSGTPLVSSDADLNAIANGSVTNGAILEFDFIPQGDTVSFRYVFGSDEYPEFSPSSFNDAFGFFLSGPGFAGPYTNGAVNVALIPGTSTPVTINNVGDQTNTAYYVNNVNGFAYGTAIQYDGTTVVLTSVAQVQCGQTYHIKLAICNVGDQGYDSGVFLEADSFSSEAVEISVATVTGDTSVVEGCTSAQFIFTRPANQVTDSLEVSYEIAGDAIMGVDYNNLPNPVYLVPGEDTVIVTLTPVADGIVEPTEFVTITAMTVTECGDTIISSGTIYLIDEPFLNVVYPPATIYCPDPDYSLTVNTTGGLPPYTYQWADGQVGPTPDLAVLNEGPNLFVVTSTDACGFEITDTVIVNLTPTLTIDSLTSNPSSACAPTGNVHGYYSGNVGPATVHWNDPAGVYNSSLVTMYNIPAGEYIFTVTNQGCSVSDTVTVNELPQLPLTFAPNDTIVKCPNDSVPVTSIPTSGTAPYTYLWQYQNQTSWPAYVPNMQNGTTVNYIVTVTDACGATGIDTIAVTLNQTLEIDTILIQNATSCNPNGYVSAILTGATGAVDYNWTGPDANPGPINIDASVLADIPSGWYYFSAVDAVCSVSDSAYVDIDQPPTALFSASQISGCSPLTVTFTNQSENTNFYHWDFGNGQTNNTASYDSQTITFEDDAIIRLIADAGDCKDTFELAITIAVCGCMDPIALNYNPLATVSTDDCIYPYPTVEVPNVFTPNEDGTNDFFELKTTNSTEITMTITNRWGNTLYDETNVNPKWDGADLEDGVYFYTYKVVGIVPDQVLEGHGFVHLIRD
jgi:gliding motility-associated-like protein